ncbi:MAG: nuclease-related domain-containing protein [Natronincolaceae bacterium]
MAFELTNSGIPMYILHDIHLETDGLTAQIDYIVITRKVNFIIECKNLIGNIIADRDGNFIREYQLGNRKVR